MCVCIAIGVAAVGNSPRGERLQGASVETSREIGPVRNPDEFSQTGDAAIESLCAHVCPDVDKVFALLGTSGSSHLLAMMPTIEENQIPAINFAAVAGAHFNPPHKTVFNIGATYCQEINGVLKHLITARKLQGAKFAIIYQDDDYGAEVKCGYDMALKSMGLKSTIEVSFKRAAKDFSAEVLAVQRAGATFVPTNGGRDLVPISGSEIRNNPLAYVPK